MSNAYTLHLESLRSDSGEVQQRYSYTIKPDSGIPEHLRGGRRTTGLASEAAAHRFVQQRIGELKLGPPQMEPLEECTHLLEDPEALRATANDKGCLFFRGLLPGADIRRVRHDLMTVIGKHGGLAEDTDHDEGIAREGVVLEGSNPTDEYRKYSNEVLDVHSFNALAHHPRLQFVMKQLLGQPLLIHPCHICHAIFPGQDVFKAPPHQDFQAIRGTTETWAAWMPFGDLDPPLGGISIAEGSHAAGLKPPAEGTLWIDPGQDQRWLWSPMQAGDVVMFHSLTVHQGRENTSGNRVRLAGSFRYQLASDPVDAGALLPQHRYGDWEDLYAGWPDKDPLRYYWQKQTLDVRPAYQRPS